MNDMKETVVRLMDGKYELRHEHGRNFRALRYGEPWRDLAGDGMVLALVQRIEELEEAATLKAAQGGVTEAMVERALIRYAMLKDQAVWPDAYSDDELEMERRDMRAALEAALSAEPAAQGEAVATVGRHWSQSVGFDLNDFREPLPPYGTPLYTAPPAQPAERVPARKGDPDDVPSWVKHCADAAGVSLYIAGWNNCLDALTATPAAPAEEGDGKEGGEVDCERCDGNGGWGRLYSGPSHLPSTACPDCNGTGKKPTGAAR